MNIKVFTIAFNSNLGSFDTGEIKSFYQSNHIVYQQAAFFTDKGKFYWSILIGYEAYNTDNAPKEKDKQTLIPTLTDEEKELYDKLKQWRKHKAQAKGFPVYLLATNNQLLQMVQQKVTTKNSLQAIKGFGKQRTAKYGEDIINIVKEHANQIVV